VGTCTGKAFSLFQWDWFRLSAWKRLEWVGYIWPYGQILPVPKSQNDIADSSAVN
jgi:hypothetical protein